jgi:S1-C subfamily serine protease
MVILAGSGHIMHGYGIPKRMSRLNAKPFVTLLPASQTPEKGIADYVLFPEPLRPPVTLKLGVALKETEGGLRVDDIMQGSKLRTAGVKKDDILVSLDDWKVEAIEDVRIFMFDRKEGDTIRIKVLRKKFLSGYQAVDLTVTL